MLGALALGALVVGPARSEPAFTKLTPSLPVATPSFELESVAGGRIGLAALADHIVLVHFFATWCEPCRDEMARLARLAGRFAGQRLAILAIDVGEAEPSVHRFLDANPVTFPILLDRDKAVARAWRVAILPTTVVLDGAQVARLVAEGDVDWDHGETDRRLAALITTAQRMDLPRSPGRTQ